MHVHKGPCEVPAHVAQTDVNSLGVGAVGAEEAFVYQLAGSSEVVHQSPLTEAGSVLPLQAGEISLIEVRHTQQMLFLCVCVHFIL